MLLRRSYIGSTAAATLDAFPNTLDIAVKVCYLLANLYKRLSMLNLQRTADDTKVIRSFMSIYDIRLLMFMPYLSLSLLSCYQEVTKLTMLDVISDILSARSCKLLSIRSLWSLMSVN